jgi:hypothetical protein
MKISINTLSNNFELYDHEWLSFKLDLCNSVLNLFDNSEISSCLVKMSIKYPLDDLDRQYSKYSLPCFIYTFDYYIDYLIKNNLAGIAILISKPEYNTVYSIGACLDIKKALETLDKVHIYSNIYNLFSNAFINNEIVYINLINSLPLL